MIIRNGWICSRWIEGPLYRLRGRGLSKIQKRDRNQIELEIEIAVETVVAGELVMVPLELAALRLELPELDADLGHGECMMGAVHSR